MAHLAFEKIAPGGVFIAETPNPQCLMVFAESFYMDLTHQKPVHPLTLEFLLKQVGFAEAKLHYSAAADDLRIPPLVGQASNLGEFNDAIEHLNNILFGFRDYAAIGIKR